MKTVFSYISFIAVLVGLLHGAPDENLQWKGKIQYEDGIKVIKNPAEPLYGKIELELKEDLSIGNEEDENRYFYGSIDIGVDNERNIYVLDRRNYRVQKFNQNGNYLMTFGRQGQGPGEFRSPGKLFVDRGDRLSVLDRGMIHVFNKHGEFENSIDLKSYAMSILPVFGKESGIITGGEPYNPRLIFYPWQKGAAIYGYSSEYKIFFIDFSGEKAFIAQKAEPPEVITRKERNEFYDNMYESFKKAKPPLEPLSMKDIKQAYPLPKYKPFFMDLFSDDEGNVYVFRMSPLFDQQKKIEFDMFNSQGYYIYKVRMTILPRLIRGGYVYRQIWDEGRGFFRVKRFKIKNWDQLKRKI